MKLVSVETPEKSVCKMTFSATAEELETASNAVYERTRASYTIKGFAKGEADRAQIEADRGEHTFWYDAINDLMDKDVPVLYDAALAEHGFHPVDEPSYDLVSVKKDEGFVATATVALQPELNLTQTTGFVVECVTPAVTDKEIDAVLERRRNAAAELVPHKGPAVKGNIVHIDYEGLLDGKPFQGGSAQNQTLQLGSGRMIPGFEDGILGHKGGEKFEINVTFPVRYHVKDLAGKPVVFKIKLIDVCVRQLPALNSDFAKKIGKVDTIEAFREQVRKQLYDGKHASALNRAKDQILTQLGWIDMPIDFFNIRFTVRGLICLMNFLMWFGNTTILLMAGIMGIDQCLFEAANMDGASSLQVFFKVTLPLLMPILVYTVITALIGGLQMFDVPQVLTNGLGTPNRSSTTLVMYLNNYLKTSKNYGMAGAISVVIFIITGLLSMVVFKSLTKQDEE